jgi:hypothetical protein
MIAVTCDPDDIANAAAGAVLTTEAPVANFNRKIVTRTLESRDAGSAVGRGCYFTVAARPQVASK